MFNPTSIETTLEDLCNEELTYRNLHVDGKVAYAGDKLTTVVEFPIESLTKKYRHLLENAIEVVTLTELEQLAYNQNPKALSHRMYGTTELWHTLLELNDMLSTIDFKPTKIKVYHPDKIKSLLNEILILEGILK